MRGEGGKYAEKYKDVEVHGNTRKKGCGKVQETREKVRETTEQYAKKTGEQRGKGTKKCAENAIAIQACPGTRRSIIILGRI